MDIDAELDLWLLRELVSSKSGMPPLLAEEHAHALVTWARAAKVRRPVLFAGAGLSLNALPRPRWKESGATPNGLTEPKAKTWKQLAERLDQDLSPNDRTSDPLWLAELYRQAHGRDALYSVIKDSVPDDLLEPGAPHKTLAQIQWEAVLTTNYDSLIERALRNAGRIPQRCFLDAHLVQSRERGKTEVIYLHGVLDEPESIILALDDYRTYSVTRPGLLTKLRQLFLQHPILLVGVSAIDPNFVQWSGWIRDLVGAHANRWLSLDIGERGSSSRAFWNGLLTFVPITAANLAPVIDLLREYLDPRKHLPSNDVVAYARVDIEKLQDRANVIATAKKHLSSAKSIQPPNEARKAQNRITTCAVRQIALLAEADPERILGECRWENKARTDDLQGQLPTTDEQVQALRTVLGQDWSTLLGAIWEHVDLKWHFSEKSSASIDLLAEFSSLPKTPATREARLGLLEDWLEHRNDGRPPSERIAEFVPDSTEADQSMLEDVRRRREFREGLQVSESTSKDTDRAQYLRFRGFFAALEGNMPAAFQHYKSAAAKSRDTCEPEQLELLTVRSALQIPIDSPADKDRENLYTREATLKSRLDEESARLEQRLRIAGYKATAELAERTIDGKGIIAQSDGGLHNTESAHLLRQLERAWVLPRQAGTLSEDEGLFQWMSGNFEEAARTLTRYGSRKLARLCEREFSQRMRRAPPQRIANVLLTTARWPPEWRARASALYHLVPELSTDTLFRILEWVKEGSTQKAIDSNTEIEGQFIVFGTESWIARTTKLVARAIGLLPPEEALHHWRLWFAEWIAQPDSAWKKNSAPQCTHKF